MKALFTILFGLIILTTSELHGQESTSTWSGRIQYQMTIDALLESDQANVGMSLKAWYFLKEKIGLGPSISYLHYNTNLEESMINIGLDALFLLNKHKKIRSYAAVNAGLGIAQYDAAVNIYEEDLASKIFIQPRVGIYLQSDRGVAFNISVGFIHQGLDIAFEQINRYISIHYNRYVLSLGVAF